MSLVYRNTSQARIKIAHLKFGDNFDRADSSTVGTALTGETWNQTGDSSIENNNLKLYVKTDANTSSNVSVTPFNTPLIYNGGYSQSNQQVTLETPSGSGEYSRLTYTFFNSSNEIIKLIFEKQDTGKIKVYTSNGDIISDDFPEDKLNNFFLKIGDINFTTSTYSITINDTNYTNSGSLFSFSNPATQIDGVEITLESNSTNVTTNTALLSDFYIYSDYTRPQKENNSNAQIMTYVDSTPTYRGRYRINGTASLKLKMHVLIGTTLDTAKKYYKYTYMRFRDSQNEMGDFELHLSGVTPNDYQTYLLEGRKIWFELGSQRVFKGRIEKVERGSYKTCKILGKDMAVIGKDAQTDRTVYTNTDTSDIVTAEINKLPGLNVGINTNYGEITVRNEYGTIISFLSNMVNSIGYDWWISQDALDNDYFNVDVTKGDGTIKKVYYVAKPNANCKSANYERDRSMLYNVVTVLGRGDGINQVRCKTYNASATYSRLASPITETDTTIVLDDASAFPSSGEVRISEERITYTGVSGNSLTGCSRGQNGTIANPHRKGAFIEKYVPEDTPEAGSSIYENGRKSRTITLRDILPDGGSNQPSWSQTAELVASESLLDHKDLVESITIYPSDRNDVIRIFKGDTVRVVDTSVGLDREFIVVEKEYTFDLMKGKLELKLTLSTKSMNLIRQMREEKKKDDNIQNFMQGSTNIYAVSEAENCADGKYLNMRFFLPPEAVQINRVKINFKLKDYRAYSTTTDDESAHTHGIPSLTVNSHSHGIPSLNVNSTSTSSTTSGSTTPASASGVSVWTPVNDDASNYSWGYVEQNIVSGGTSIYTSRYETLISNYTGSSHTVYPRVRTISGNTISGSTYNLTNGNTYRFNTGESSGTTSGWFRCDDAYGSTTRVGGVADIVYTHTHGSHYHSIPSLTVHGTTTQSSTTSSAGSTTSSTTTTAGSAHHHGIAYGIVEQTLTDPSVDLYVGEDGGSMTLVGTYTTDQTNVDVTDIVTDVGRDKWINIQFRPNKNMRIEANAYIQIFINSE